MSAEGRVPSRYKTPEDEARGSLDPEFVDWRRQDQLLMSWLLASMTKGLLTRVVGCNFACEIWEKNMIHFTSKTRAKVKQFKMQLCNVKKGSLKMNEYLLKVKGIVDSLTAVGSPVPEVDYIESIFDGLPDEYELVITTMFSKTDSYTVDEIEALLLAQSRATRGRNLNGIFVNYRGRGKRGFGFRGGRRGGRNFQNFQNFNFQPNQNFSNVQKQQQLVCQLCGKGGHSVWSCYHWFDYNFQPSQYNSSSNKPQGHISAMITTPETLQDSNLYLDSGTSNHIKPEVQNLMTNTDYSGQELVHVGNAAGLPIHSIGHSFINNSSHSKPLFLHDLLYVPKITKNLVSVSKFCKDNSVFLEFHPDSCCVKSQVSKETLLEGEG